MSEIKFPRGSIQLTVSIAFEKAITDNMTRRGMVDVTKYIRQLVDEDCQPVSEGFNTAPEGQVTLDEAISNTQK